jgi:DNA-binding GntR family transcriptional regulator
LSASTIPIREALQRLVGERLVEARDHNGFYAPHISEVGLRDLYQAQHAMLLWTLEHGAFLHLQLVKPAPARATASALSATEKLFDELADRSGNRELQWSLHNAIDRLHAVCLAKEAVAANWACECERLLEQWRHGDISAFKEALQGYHCHRIELVPALVDRLNQPRTMH